MFQFLLDCGYDCNSVNSSIKDTKLLFPKVTVLKYIVDCKPWGKMQEGAFGEGVEGVSFAAGGRAFDLLPRPDAPDGVERPLAVRRGPAQGAFGIDLIQQVDVLPFLIHCHQRVRPVVAEGILEGRARRQVGDGDDDPGIGVFDRDGRSAAPPAGAWGDIHSHSKPFGLRDAMLEHFDPSRRKGHRTR